VANTDWPSRPGLSVAAQKAELLAILDRARLLKLNAVIFQVRPQCDAFYQSPIEPWSEYLSGAMGQPPAPFYDPLAFAIDEAHKRGLELHAWFNPFRARHFESKSPIAPNHVSRARPALVRPYGRYLWLDPGEPAVQDYTLGVVMDVVRRYDVDGVQFDDYFYPYAETNSARKPIEFPDGPTWRKYGGNLSRDDWRRENVNHLIERTYSSIKSAKPWVKFGVSPFGVWRPGFPPQAQGVFDAYGRLYGDSRKWLASGWVDYFSPQLYWPIQPPRTSFPALLHWWSQQDRLNRPLWPGLAAYNADKWPPNEITRQITITREETDVSGYVLYSAGSLLKHAQPGQQLERLNGQCALVPAMPWLAGPSPPPAQPNLSVTAGPARRLRLNWTPLGPVPVRWWLIQQKTPRGWTTEILPGGVSSDAAEPDLQAAAVTAVDRVGRLSPPRLVPR
jgi:uncharacterized lipoprotein YddW (UPF0748 family)